MANSMGREALDGAAKDLVGRVLSSVSYVGMDDSEFPDKVGHVVDYGVDLCMSDGDTFGFIWSSTTPFSIVILRSSVTSEIGHPRTWNMTNTPEWHRFIDQRITAATVAWAEQVSWQMAPVRKSEPDRVWYPQDVDLTFGAFGSVWLSTLETDNVYAVFDEAIARSYGLGRFAPREPSI